MPGKIRVPEPSFHEQRDPSHTRYTFIVAEGKMMKVSEMPDGARAHGRPDIERIDVDFTASGDIAQIVVYADAKWERRRGRRTPDEMWPVSDAESR